MANEWLRLWHDMPNDPKWRTVARHAKQPISLVQAVYLHMLVDASRNVTRGHVTVTSEDLASALDCDEDQIQAVLSAMQGRVMDGEYLTGWEKRQPKREDAGDPETGAKSAAERKRAQREREKQAEKQAAEQAGQPQCHGASRKVTLDKDKDTDIKEPQTPQAGPIALPKNRTRTTGIELQTFVAECKAKGERPLRDYAPLWDYTQSVGMPADYVALAWAEFLRRFMPGGAQESKRQKDWRCTFRKYVENNYFKLWAIDKDGNYFLTTQGKQAEKFQETKAAA